MSTIFKFLLLLILTLGLWAFLRTTLMKSLERFYKGSSQFIPEADIGANVGFEQGSLEALKTTLDEAYITMNQVLQESESAKTILELQKGMKYLEEAIKERDILAGDTTHSLPIIKMQKTELTDPKEFCPEKYMGSKEDYPLYLKKIPLDPSCKVPPLNKMVSVLFNFVDEIPISKAEDLFEDAAFGEYKNMTFIAFVKPNLAETEKLKTLAKAKLPNMKIVEQTKLSEEENHSSVLAKAVSYVETKYVVLTRNIERFDHFSTIIRLVRDISLGKAEIVSGAHRNSTGHWRAGCYQMKQNRGEMAFDEGYDFSNNGCMFCDYVSGPFGIKKETMVEYLKSVEQNNLSGDQFYMNMHFYFRQQMKKKILMCIDSMFYTKTSGLLPANKTFWMPFLKQNKISKMIFPNQTAVHESACNEVDLSCLPEKDLDLPFCCYKEAEKVLAHIKKYLQESKIRYHFYLPDGGPLWNKFYMENLNKNLILIGVDDLTKLSKLEFPGFSWSFIGHQFSSEEWNIVFQEESKFLSDVINIRFRGLLLPVNMNPGKALAKYGEDHCTKDKICFDLLHFYGPLDSQKVWM